MKDFKQIFLDTAPIIYYLQRSEKYYTNMQYFWENYMDFDYVTSTITITEYLTYPYRQKELKMINNFYSFVEDMDIGVREIDRSIAEKAAQIRAEYNTFKTMDSLQLATACITGCEIFLTNDKQLKQFKEIKCVLVEELG